MENDMAWQGGFASTFDAQLGQSNEDWEDWLRWDPAAGDQTSPDMGFSHAGSSKNDSPVQDPVFPVSAFDGLNGTIAPPLIVGDSMDFASGSGDADFAFGTENAVQEGFSFDPALMGQVDTTTTVKPFQLDISIPAQPLIAPEEQALLSALSADPTFGQATLSQAPPAVSTTEHSPASSNSKRTSLSSQTSPDPPPKKKGGRKRKVDAVEKEPVDDGEQQYDEDGRPIKKTSHNVIEKRYRNNLNDKIVALRNSVPALRAMSRINAGDDSEDLEGLAPAHKLNKATVMAKATEYIKHLEKRNNTMQDDMNALKARLAAVEANINQSRDRQASMSISPPSGTMRPREMSNASQSAQTYLNVPTQQRQQQQYAQQQSPPSYNRPPNPPVEAQNQVRGGRSGMMNKLMLGSMAGLMVMEGYTESSGSSSDGSSRGLFAVPGLDRLVRRGATSSPGGALSSQAFMPLLKLLLVLGAVVYLIAPLLTPRSKAKQAARTPVRLPKAPSLASPVEVRRKAWLTAVQSVWIPKHFLLEVYAVASKMLKLSIRRLIGAETYTMLTGLNSEEEAARIKAWDIAIDAQLAGGDAEVSYYRLLLTLMASGTLPDSPTRLMQKAVHFRVFFWDVANAGYGNLVGFKQLTERVGKIYWEAARKQQRELLHAKQPGRPTAGDEADLLPDHLARLVELDCDEVLGDEMIQRAWNLAWNKPSAHALMHNAARDSVVEDHAIRSPLDAVAAWYSNILIDETLADTLSTKHSKIDMEYYLGLAVSVAPPASGTQARSLAAKAVLSNTNRDANIITALECLPASSPSSPSMNIVSHAPASPEVRTALTLAKLIALSTATTPPIAKQHASQALARLTPAPEQFTLLTAVASVRLLQVMTADRHVSSSIDHSAEDLACSLRVWVGTGAGRSSGLLRAERNRIVEVCLGVVRKIGGWEVDSGYGSRGGSPTRTEEATK